MLGPDEDDEVYGDIEEDFNVVFKNEDIIRKQFGQSLKVALSFNSKSGDVKRVV